MASNCRAPPINWSGTIWDLIDDKARSDPRFGATLMRILDGRQRVAETLEAMHRSGVLGALIPEFGNLYARVLHDLYHIYTVDRHSLVAVRELERLRAGEFKATTAGADRSGPPGGPPALDLPGPGSARHRQRPRPSTITSAARRWPRKWRKRLGLDTEQIDAVVFLVRNHLLMSEIAQKRDIEDDHLVKEFAREVGSIERLKELYLMTFADMRAVAPKVYNNWRDMLLKDLYMKTLKILEQGDREAVDPARLIDLTKTELRNQLASPDPERAQAWRSSWSGCPTATS